MNQRATDALLLLQPLQNQCPVLLFCQRLKTGVDLILSCTGKTGAVQIGRTGLKRIEKRPTHRCVNRIPEQQRKQTGKQAVLHMKQLGLIAAQMFDYRPFHPQLIRAVQCQCLLRYRCRLWRLVIQPGFAGTAA